MSPRRPHLRNRKRIKAPRRFEDADVITSSPRQELHEESEASSELEEEIYQSPKPKKPKSKPRAYHGQVIEFNPNLPPAAFPTLDYPDYIHNGGNVPIDLESHLSGLQSRESELVDSEEITLFTSGRSCHRGEIDLIGNHPTMTSTTANSTLPGSQIVTQTSIKAPKQRRANIPTSIYGESTDNGPRNPIWASNMARMEAAGRINDLARNILEMAPSSEEDEAEEDVAMEDAASRPTRLARTDSIPELPAWDDLTVAHKLDLADAVAELFYPDPWQVMHQLRLSVPQKKELAELLIQRQERAAKEKANQQRLQEQTRDALLQGKRLSQPTFHQMVEENLYEDISEDEHLRTTLKELKKARAYLKYCGFDPALADEIWDVPPILSAARPAQSKPKASLTSTAAQTPPRLSEGPFSRRPAFLTPQQDSYPPDPRLGLLQQHTQGAMPQHRPTPPHALIAQHSPAAPLSKVPLQSFRIAPGNRNGGLSARSQGRAGVPQPIRPALPTGPRVARPALPTPQEKHSLPAGSHSPTPRCLPTERRNQEGQSGGNPNGGAAASQGTGGVLEDKDSVNKKKRKKSGIRADLVS